MLFFTKKHFTVALPKQWAGVYSPFTLSLKYLRIKIKATRQWRVAKNQRKLKSKV